MLKLIDCVNVFTVVETLFPVGFSYEVASILLENQEACEKHSKAYYSALKRFQTDLKGVVKNHLVQFPTAEAAQQYQKSVEELENSTVKVNLVKIKKAVFEEQLKGSDTKITPGQLKYLKLILEA